MEAVLEGVGEDVVYEAVDQVALQEARAVHDLRGPVHAEQSSAS